MMAELSRRSLLKGLAAVAAISVVSLPVLPKDKSKRREALREFHVASVYHPWPGTEVKIALFRSDGTPIKISSSQCQPSEHEGVYTWSLANLEEPVSSETIYWQMTNEVGRHTMGQIFCA